MENLDNVLDKLRKAINTTTGADLIRENLSGYIDKLAYKQTPIRDRLTRKAGSGKAATWDVLTAIGTGNSAFTEGGTPNEDDATYDQRSAIYKELGKTKTITDRQIAAGASFIDQEAHQTEVAMHEVLQDEEVYIISGNATTAPLQFDGLDTYITTNTIDDANDALGFRTDLLDEAVQTLVETYGVIPTAIYCSFGMKRAINQALNGNLRVDLSNTNTPTTGIDVNFYQSMVGKLPIIASTAITNDSTTYTPNTVGDIYVVTEMSVGQPVLYMEDLYPLSKIQLARTGAGIKFMVTEATVLVCRAEEMQVKISNVRIS